MNKVYFDNASTTQPSNEVIDYISETMRDYYGNPSSLHEMGLSAELRIKKAEKQILKALGTDKGKIYFTSGGTESNNLALISTSNVKNRLGSTIVTDPLEHSSVIATAEYLKEFNKKVITIEPTKEGQLPLENLKKVLNPDVILVSMMMVNNEVGSIMPIKEAVKLTRELAPNAYFHCDAVQAFGKIPFTVRDLGIDMMSISGHKIHAPKGIGALYVAPGVRIMPMLHGGEQQDKIRPGTESVPLICGFGLASEIAQKNLKTNYEKVLGIKNKVIEELKNIDGVIFNGKLENSSPYILNFSIPGYKSETLLHYLSDRGVYVSSGSACQKGAASHVLIAMGLEKARVDSALRISFSDYNTKEDAEYFIQTLKTALESLTHK